MRTGNAERAPPVARGLDRAPQPVAILAVHGDEPVPPAHGDRQAGDLGEAIVRPHDAVGRRAAEDPGTTRQRRDVEIGDLVERVP